MVSKSRRQTRQAVPEAVDRPWILAALNIATLALLTLGAFLPQERVWGINILSFFPAGWKFGFIAADVLALAVVLRVTSGSVDERPLEKRSYLLWSGVAGSLLFACFVLLPNQTHFLGDGYQLLARLTDHAPLVKSWEMVIASINGALFATFGGASRDDALLAFRVTSYVSGLITLICVFDAARLLFDQPGRRILFALGVLSTGTSLLFFGYVENYPLFVAMVVLSVLMGLLGARGTISRWWMLLPTSFAMLFHIFGVALIPGVFYLLLHDSGIGHRWQTLPLSIKLMVALILGIGALAIYWYLYTTNYFFRFAVLPLTKDQFTVEGETLFAPKRLADLLNFLILLLPGLPVLIAAMVLYADRATRSSVAVKFLMITTLSALGILFLFNPKLGLPRDWDLFSFSTIPLSVLAYYTILSPSDKGALRQRAVMLSIALGFVVLGARVAAHIIPEVALAQIRSYLDLDKVKTRTGRVLLISYFEEQKDLLQAKKENDEAEAAYPEVEMNRKAVALIQAHRYSDAATLCRRVIAANPQYADAYGNLGLCYMETARLDSAIILIQISNGLNPNNPVILSGLAAAYQRRGRYARAEKLLLEALAIDSLCVPALTNMSVGSLALGKPEQSVAYLRKVAAATGKEPKQVFIEAGDVFLERGCLTQAREAYQIALDRGMDSAYVLGQLQKCDQK